MVGCSRRSGRAASQRPPCQVGNTRPKPSIPAGHKQACGSHFKRARFGKVGWCRKDLMFSTSSFKTLNVLAFSKFLCYLCMLLQKHQHAAFTNNPRRAHLESRHWHVLRATVLCWRQIIRGGKACDPSGDWQEC